MGYSFQGIFTNTTEKTIMEAARGRWPFCSISHVNDPFKGIAIYRKEETNEEISHYEREDNLRLENELPPFSVQFPEITFIYLWADCHGGTCVYEGFACRKGEIIVDNRGKDPGHFSRDFERDKLREVVRALGVELNEMGYFEPFERGFFDEMDRDKGRFNKLTPILGKKKAWWRLWL